jgi:hypothetical protein
MGECRKMKSLFLESLYGELDMDRKESLKRHLAGCRECSEEYEKMAETLRTMSKKAVPDPGQEFWDGYWDRLELRMKREGLFEPSAAEAQKRSGIRFGFFPRWAYGAAGAAAILAVGILIGRLFFSRPVILSRQAPTGTPSVLPASGTGDLILRTSRYLERSKVILLALVNFDPEKQDVYGLNLPRQKEVSNELVKEASALKSDLKNAKERQLEKLVGDLEMILMQIANLKSEYDLPTVEIIKAGVEQKDVLFKISLNEMRRTEKKSRVQGPPALKSDAAVPTASNI